MANVDLTRIASNIGALNTLLSLQNINKQLGIHQARLASGKRINSAADDPAGLTIATKLLSRSESLKVAMTNISDANNLLAVAEAGLGRINDIIVQMRNKSQQASSDTVGTAEREAISAQLRAYVAQIDDIVGQTDWNGNKLIDGSYETSKLTFQTGGGADNVTDLNGMKDMSATTVNGLKLGFNATGSVLQESFDGGSVVTLLIGGAAAASLTSMTTGLYQIKVTGCNTSVTIAVMNAAGTVLASTNQAAAGAFDFSAQGYFGGTVTLPAQGVTSTIIVGYTKKGDINLSTDGTSVTGTPLGTQQDFRKFMSHVEGKLNEVSAQLALVGAMEGRLTFKEDQVGAAQINIEGSYSRIMNANMAEEQVNASKYLILQQTATAMLSQANTAPQFLLSLFK